MKALVNSSLPKDILLDGLADHDIVELAFKVTKSVLPFRRGDNLNNELEKWKVEQEDLLQLNNLTLTMP